jgi:hypothetical protein
MNQLNPNAIALWIFASSVGYLIGGASGVALGLAIITGLQIISALFIRD